jgi:predicted nucleic acid-binding protein
MPPRVLVDTDVVLDLLLAREPFSAVAIDLFLLIQDGVIEGCISPLAFSNLFYILRQKIPAREAVNALRKLKLLTRVLTMDERIVDLALASSFHDFEDALQYYTALSHGLDGVVTRNRRDYRSAELPILDAAECIERFGTAR